MQISVVCRSVILLGLLLFCCSCQSYMPSDTPPALRKLGRTMDKLSALEAEYGTMSISTPVLARLPSNSPFSLARTGKQYFDDAKMSRQGSVSSTDSSKLIALLAAEIGGQGGAGNQSVATLSKKGETARTATATQPSTTAQGQGKGGKIVAAKSNTEPTVDDLTAIDMAAADTTEQTIFQLLAGQGLDSNFDRQVTFCGVCTVSVVPGWRTKKNFAADVAMQVGYELQPATPQTVRDFIHDTSIPGDLRMRIAKDNGIYHLPNDKVARKFEHCCPKCPSIPREYWSSEKVGRVYFGPEVAAVSPFTHIQTLDLRSNLQAQRDFSLTLAAEFLAAHQPGDAKVFMNYARQLNQTFSSVSPDVVVNSYSCGPFFGYQVGPRFKAVADVKAGKATGPAQVLDRQSFPALVLFTADKSDLIPKVAKDCRGRYQLYQVCLDLVSGNQWVRTGNHEFLRRYFWLDPQFNESTRLGLGYDLLKQFHAAKKELNRSSYTATEKSNSTRSRLLKQYWPSATAPGKSPSEQCRKVTHGMHEDADLIALMRVRSNGLRDRLYGAESIVYLPPNITSYTTRKFPCKLRIAPKVIVMDKKDAKGHLIPKRIHVLIAGKNLKSVDFRDISVLGGKAAKITRPPSFIGGAIELQVTITKAGVPIAFKLPLKGRPRSVYLITPPIIGMPTKKCLTKIINRNVYLITPPIIGN